MPSHLLSNKLQKILLSPASLSLASVLGLRLLAEVESILASGTQGKSGETRERTRYFLKNSNNKPSKPRNEQQWQNGLKTRICVKCRDLQV